MTWLLALLLRCCPRGFRDAYGAEICELVEIRRARLRGSRRAILALWCRCALDIGVTAAAEWADVLTGRTVHQHHDPQRLPMSDRLSLDLRDACRRLLAAPGFSISALLILAIGIGGSTAIFSAVDAFVLRELPFARPHELVRVYQDSDEGQPESNAYPAYLDVAAHDTLFSGTAAVMPGFDGTLLNASGDAEVVPLEFATSTYFPVLGLQPALGRWFSASEDTPGAPAVAVVSHNAWRRRFGSDPTVLGRTIRLSGSAVTIVGVGPAEYNGFLPGLATEFWLSISSLRPVAGAFAERTLTRREDHWFQVVARLATGRTVEQAQRAMTDLAERLGREFPETDRGRRITVMSLDRVRVHPDIDAMLYPAAGLNLLLSALVLVLVCSNLASLTLARGAARTRELAVRLAIGATRAQIVRSLALESVLLALAGGAFGLLFARWAVTLPARVDMLPAASLITTIAIDYRVLVFALAVSLASGLAFGLLPAIRTTRSDLRPSLQPGASIRSFRRAGMRGLLISIQVAISVTLLAGSGILLRGVSNALHADPGFTPAPLALVSIDTGQGGRPFPQGIRMLQELRGRVTALPGVESAALTTRPPVTAFGASNTIVLDGQAAPDAAGGRTVEVRTAAVTPGYFTTLGVPLLHGRAFTEADREGAEPVAIVSDAMASRFWGTSNVVGLRYRHQGSDRWIRIVGVAGRVTIETPGEAPAAFFYRPFAQAGFTRATLIARTAGDPAPLVRLIRQEVRAIDSLVPVTLATTMTEHIARAMAVPRAAAVVLSASGVLAVLLACLGIYSVVAFSVARRRTEMGVRMALGATSAQVVRLVLREMLTLVVVGLAAGVALAALIAPALGNVLVGIQPLDPVIFAAVAALVGGVALATTWVPARRAANTDPAAVLRAE